MGRRVNINLLVFAAAFVVMIMWLASNVVSFKQVDRPFKVTADFENAFGVLANAEVAYIGVPFGHVSRVERITNGVRITMSIDRGRQIPRGSTANIGRKSAIGEQFINLYPPTSPLVGGVLSDGDHIAREDTTVPLEFSEFLRSASGVLGALPPGAVGTIVHETATGLDGRADSLRQLATAGDKLTAVLASRTAALDRISANGGKLTKALADHRVSLGASLDNLAALNDALANAKGDLGVILDKAAPLTKQLADLVGNHKAELDCDLKVLEVVIDHATTPINVDGLRALLTWAPAAFAGIWDSRDVEAEGVWVRVGTIVNPTGNAPVQYIPPRALPPVLPAPACVSQVAASNIDYSPAAATKAAPFDASGWALGFGLVTLTAVVVVRSATKMSA